MSTIDILPLTSQPSTVDFMEPHSLAIRIWHWTFFVVLTASLTTVLFGSTLFRTNDNIAGVQQDLLEKGATVTKDQARSVAHAYSDKLWDLHKYIGFGLVGLLLIRVIIEIAQPGDERLRTRIRKAVGFKAAALPTGDLSVKKYMQYYGRVKWTYVIFYVLIATMALTGLGLAFEDVPLFSSWHRGITNVHQFVQYFIYTFILIHLVGVIRADVGRHKGLVSGMIHGKVSRQD
jgi:Ni/Fe-hydrogenase 1 B-type cytochrome subunit